MIKTAGLDGCRAGWLLVSFDDKGLYKVLRTEEEFRETLHVYDHIFIDMPIGLEEDQYTRTCDRLLREKLGSEYASSVFSPPIRPALHAPSYVEANMQSYEITEKKLSLQAWNITPKIKMLDRLLQVEPELRVKVFESHPELLFMILNGGQIYQKKKTKRGLRHRLDLISALEPVADDFFRDIKEEFRRNEVAEDDIVDAMVLALAAKETHPGTTGQLATLPEEPEVDETGLVKAIHYVKRFREAE